MSAFRHNRRRASGFTLVELLVVVGIIAILIAMLMPVLSRVRQQALVATCASDQRQFVNAMTLYALDNGGYFPRFDNASGAANTSDHDWSLFNVLHGKYGLPLESFFCRPVDEQLTTTNWNVWGSEICIGYAVWVPHKCTGVLVPPAPDGSLTVVGNQPIAGATRPGNGSNDLPVLADALYIRPQFVSDPTTFDFTRAPQEWYWYDYGGHFLNARLESINVAFADGHVEHRVPSEVRCRYLSYNSWNCR